MAETVTLDSIRPKYRRRDLVILGFALTLIALTLGPVLGLVSVWRLSQNEGQVAHAHEVMQQFETLLATLTDAETGQRGYLLAEDENYLRPYDEAVQRVEITIGRLKELISNNPQQQARFAALEPKISEKLDELKRTVALMRGHDRDGALRIVHSNEGNVEMDEIRKDVADMEHSEEDLLQRRADESRTSLRAAFLSILVPAAIATILLAIVFYLNRRNIIVRLRTAEMLDDQRERLRVTLASIGDAVITTDAGGAVTSLNAVAESLTGWKQEEAAGEPLEVVFRIVNERTRIPAPNPVAKALRDGIIVGLANHTVLIRKDGTELPIDDSAAPIRSEAHGLIGCVLVFRDISKRRQADAEREKLLATTEHARGEAEVLVANFRRIQSITETALNDLPFERMLDELVRRVSEALASDTATLLLENDGVLHVRAAVGLEEEVRARVAVPVGKGFAGSIAKERRHRILNEVNYDEVVSGYFSEKGIKAVVGVPLLSAGGGGVLGVLHVGSIRPRTFGEEDVRILELAAERVALAVEHAARMEAQHQARELAETSNRAKDEFLAMLGHELRNPLAAVSNAVATASLDDARRPRALEIARRQIEQLGRLIDDLLDVARITQGRISLRKQPIHLSEVIQRAVESSRSFIEARSLELEIADVPQAIRVDADPVRLEQILVNVLSNAAKFTEVGGKIDLWVELQGEEVTIHVRDTGIGIAREMLSRIWDLFTQGERGLDRSQGGLGVGLTVARRLVELHGGRIDCRSDGIGKGAEFVITLAALPATTEAAAFGAAPEFATKRSARVLLVEDNPDTAEGLTMLLEVLGHRVRAVYDGLTALEVARENIPDAMFVDIGLPDMNGYEVARRLRRDPKLKFVVLVALTGYGREEDRQQAMAAGFDYHLVKPVNPEALHQLLERLTKNGTADRPPVQ